MKHSSGAFKPTLAQRRQALVEQCAQQRRQMSNEIAIFRAPSVLSGGSIISTLTTGKFKIALALAGMVMGLVAARSRGAMPLVSTGMSLFRMVKSLVLTIRAKAA